MMEIAFQYNVERVTEWRAPRDDYLCSAIETCLSPDGIWGSEEGEVILFVGDEASEKTFMPYYRPLLVESFLAYCASVKTQKHILPKDVRKLIFQHLLKDPMCGADYPMSFIEENIESVDGSLLKPKRSKKKPRVRAPRYFVNVTKREYIDLKEMPKEEGRNKGPKFHPLPIKCTLHEPHPHFRDPEDEKTWLGDRVRMDFNVPEGFSEVWYETLEPVEYELIE